MVKARNYNLAKRVHHGAMENTEEERNFKFSSFKFQPRGSQQDKLAT